VGRAVGAVEAAEPAGDAEGLAFGDRVAVTAAAEPVAPADALDPGLPGAGSVLRTQDQPAATRTTAASTIPPSISEPLRDIVASVRARRPAHD
jgi:hypothetical protein